MSHTGESGDRLKELLQQALELSVRQRQVKEQRPVLSSQPTRAERRAFARWEAKFEQLGQALDRLDAEVNVEIARWKAAQNRDRQPAQSANLPEAGS